MNHVHDSMGKTAVVETTNVYIDNIRVAELGNGVRLDCISRTISDEHLAILTSKYGIKPYTYMINNMNIHDHHKSNINLKPIHPDGSPIMMDVVFDDGIKHNVTMEYVCIRHYSVFMITDNHIRLTTIRDFQFNIDNIVILEIRKWMLESLIKNGMIEQLVNIPIIISNDMGITIRRNGVWGDIDIETRNNIIIEFLLTREPHVSVKSATAVLPIESCT